MIFLIYKIGTQNKESRIFHPQRVIHKSITNARAVRLTPKKGLRCQNAWALRDPSAHVQYCTIGISGLGELLKRRAAPELV